jgi:hypothetical protein
LGDEISVRIEDLDAIIRPVGDKHTACRIERDVVRLIELARAETVVSPFLAGAAARSQHMLVQNPVHTL